MNKYEILYKRVIASNFEQQWPGDCEWDIFISSFNSSERVTHAFNKANAKEKWWFIQPDYQFDEEHHPSGNVFAVADVSESEFIHAFIDKTKLCFEGKRLCIDITGFVKPLMMYFMAWLRESGINYYDVIYSEPKNYIKKENTQFSDEIVNAVRQVELFEGVHCTESSNDLLIIGAGYDHELIAYVAEEKKNARKVKLYGFPSLRPDMFQQNLLRVNRVEESVNRVNEDCYYSSANDPFATAGMLSKIVNELSPDNLYLCPLATKPQALGFAFFFLSECRGKSVSLIYPFCEGHSQKTSTGVNRIWQYTVEYL